MLLTFSSINAFKTCRKRYQFRYVDGLELKDRPMYFDFGTAIHLGLAAHYQGKQPMDAVAEMEKYFADKAPGPDDLERVEKWTEARFMAVAMLGNYIRHYPSEKFKVLETEKPFELPIFDVRGEKFKDVMLAGKVDGVVEENGLWVLEHKTASVIDSRYQRKLTLDAQSMIYLEAMERVYGKRFNGVLYNVLAKSVPGKPEVLKSGKLSQAKAQNTTPELYRQAIQEKGFNEADYAEILAWLDANRKQYFYREYLTFSGEERDEWRRELWQIAADIERATETGAFYRSTSQCVGFGTCPFLDICTAPDKDFVINQSYEHKAAHSELAEEVA